MKQLTQKFEHVVGFTTIGGLEAAFVYALERWQITVIKSLTPLRFCGDGQGILQ